MPDYYDRARGVPAFSAAALYGDRSVSINAGDRPQQVTVMQVTPSFFPLLQVSPLLGRTFTGSRGRGRPGAQDRPQLCAWQELYGGRRRRRRPRPPRQRRAVHDRRRHAAGLQLPQSGRRAWIPAAFTAEDKSDDARYDENYDYVGRLKPGATLAQAQAQLAAIDRANFERLRSSSSS